MNSDKPKKILDDAQKQAAVNAVRKKLDALYGEEPDAKQALEQIESKHHEGLSKHQQFMDQLGGSGKSLAEIQTSWHEYYQQLSDTEKHEVWREFYKKHEEEKKKKSAERLINSDIPVKHRPGTEQLVGPQDTEQQHLPSSNKIKQKIIHNVAKSKLQGNHKKQSIVFGMVAGFITLVIFMFGFFNEQVLTPFIRPSYAITTPVIVDPNSNEKVSSEPKIIIPKINVEAPVVYDEESIQEKDIQKALERGVVHYSTTPNPGEKGNSVIVGHSSSNILNRGKYKFAFLLLKSLEDGDTFIVHKDSKRYVYKVYKKYVTSPTDFSVLGPSDKPSTMTLITCDPPGLSTNRLIIVGEQIFPDPTKNKQSQTDPGTSQAPDRLPANAPSLWQRLKDWIF